MMNKTNDEEGLWRTVLSVATLALEAEEGPIKASGAFYKKDPNQI